MNLYISTTARSLAAMLIVILAGSLMFSQRPHVPDSGHRPLPPTYPAQSPHAPIVIESNADFESQGWPGSGSQANPYRISDLEIDSMVNGACINISNTDVHFVIQGCTFPHEGYSEGDIALNSVQNGLVISCVFETAPIAVRLGLCSSISLETLNLTSSVLLIESSSDILVAYCDIEWAPGDGIWADSSDLLEITGNTVSGSAASGVVLEDTDNSLVFSNILRDNTDHELIFSGSSQGNTVYANRFQGESGSLAYDEGNDNSWDNGEGIGNYWSDYLGSGFYYVDGPAGSIDHFPTGPSSTTTTGTTTTTPGNTTTTTTTSTNTTKETIYTTLQTYIPLDPELRGMLVGTFSALLIGTAMIVILLVVRSRRAIDMTQAT
ncbi:hypothetical protein EU538_02390 [Candidatus Thorarchaeota archaeon]|nr:MAG: hypothetical protein EU538_02390 [Candidatus Thorarchaeota archaeon]